MKSNIKTKFAGLAVVLAFLAPSLTFAQESKTYTVKAGDTLSEIAETHNTTVEKLAKLNNIKNIHLIYVDQVLVIDGEAPVVEESYSAPASTVSGSEAEAKEWIAQKESGGSYTATNGRYIGRYQLTDSYLNGDYSAENQERVADAYVAGRYGSWTEAKNFWLNNGWY